MSEQSNPPRPAPTKLFLGIAVAVALAVTMVTAAFRLHRQDPSWARIHDDLILLNSALEKYHADHGVYPDEGSMWEVLVPKYVPSVPVDPWGREYIYENNGNKPLLLTFGQDGERGGTGAEQDHHQFDGHVR
ncbi:type II secretion system protein GspG [Hyalangium versicolor]|uniref:type II secretion system protein GspG n=1 Tax=Hyalangium versicolor TaxID=2861190 RepID=UPI001CCAE11E|nr:type II secretion system protein GspG [Hyalangium versicolor]